MSRQTTTFFTGPAGSGKTYAGVSDIVNDFLPYGTGKLITNLPLNVDACVERCWRKFSKVQKLKPDQAKDVLRSRIHIIPEEVWKSWLREESHLADYLGETEITGALLWIDEIQNFAGKDSTPEYIQKWRVFLGELRHRKASAVFATQHDGKVHKALINECAQQAVCSTIDTEFTMGIQNGDWLDLIAGFTKKRIGGCLVKYRRMEAGRWKDEKPHYHYFRDEIFGLYDSHAKPIAVDQLQLDESGLPIALREKSHWETLSKRQLLGWFIGRNWWPLGKKAAIAGVFFGLATNPWIVKELFLGFQNRLKAGQMKAEARKEAAEIVSNGRVRILAESADEFTKAAGTQKLAEMNNQLQVQVAVLTGRLASMQAKNEWMSAVALIDETGFMLRSGRSYKIGERIDDGGPYNGRMVRRVDIGGRLVQLDNGAILRMRSAQEPCTSCGGESVAESVRSAQPGGAEKAPVTPAKRTVDQSGGGRSDGAERRLLPVPADGALDSSVGKSRPAGFVPVGKKSASVERLGGDLSPFGSSGQPGGGDLLPRGASARGSGGFVQEGGTTFEGAGASSGGRSKLGLRTGGNGAGGNLDSGGSRRGSAKSRLDAAND